MIDFRIGECFVLLDVELLLRLRGRVKVKAEKVSFYSGKARREKIFMNAY